MKKVSVSSIQEMIDFAEALEDEDECLTFNEILQKSTAETHQALKAEVMAFTEEDIEPIHNMLAKYYKLRFPTALIKEVIAFDLELALELKNGAITDTYVRSGVFSGVMRMSKAFLPMVQDEKTFRVRRNFDFPDVFFQTGLTEEESAVVAEIKQQIENAGGTIITS